MESSVRTRHILATGWHNSVKIRMIEGVVCEKYIYNNHKMVHLCIQVIEFTRQYVFWGIFLTAIILSGVTGKVSHCPRYPWARYRTSKCSHRALLLAGNSSRGVPCLSQYAARIGSKVINCLWNNNNTFSGIKRKRCGPTLTRPIWQNKT